MIKKVSKKNKSQRSKKEILRAQANSSVRDFAYKVDQDDYIVNAKDAKKITQNLNLSIIKTDLIKTGFLPFL